MARQRSERRKQARAAAQIVLASGMAREVRIITPPPELPSKGDVIDAVQRFGWGRTEIEKLIAEAKLFDPSEPEPEPPETPAPRARTPRRKGVLRCFFDFRSLPLEVFRLSEDGRQAKHLWRKRRAVAMELAGYANPDGSSITISVETVMNHLGMSHATVHRHLDDLTALGMLASQKRGFHRSCLRILKPPRR